MPSDFACKLSVTHDKIDFVAKFSEQNWALPVNSVKVIGEYTLNTWGDDYFFVFITQDGSCWHASFYADGMDEALGALSERLGSTLRPGLCNSVDWQSKILYPTHLEGRNVFEVIPHKASGLLNELWSRAFPTSNVRLSREIRLLLNLSDSSDAGL